MRNHSVTPIKINGFQHLLRITQTNLTSKQFVMVFNTGFGPGPTSGNQNIQMSWTFHKVPKQIPFVRNSSALLSYQECIACPSMLYQNHTQSTFALSTITALPKFPLKSMIDPTKSLAIPWTIWPSLVKS